MTGKLRLEIQLESVEQREAVELAIRVAVSQLAPHASVVSKVVGFRPIRERVLKLPISTFEDVPLQRLVLKYDAPTPKYFYFPNLHVAPIVTSNPTPIPFILIQLPNGHVVWGHSKDRFSAVQMAKIWNHREQVESALSQHFNAEIKILTLGWLIDDGLSDYRGYLRKVNEPPPAYKAMDSVRFTVREIAGDVGYYDLRRVNNYWDLRTIYGIS